MFGDKNISDPSRVQSHLQKSQVDVHQQNFGRLPQGSCSGFRPD
jgi:hypothetical protein